MRKRKLKVGMYIKDRKVRGGYGIIYKVTDGLPSVVYLYGGNTWDFSIDELSEIEVVKLDIQITEVNGGAK